ncbi:hypothetical protein VPHD480_0279 [Vibrio phage D480]
MLKATTKFQIFMSFLMIWLSWDWFSINHATDAIPYFIAIIPGVMCGMAIQSSINDLGDYLNDKRSN